jgi:hypothetical protein
VTPQSHFNILAPIAPERLSALRELLQGMNVVPGFAAPDNGLVPFGSFDRLHFARLVVLEDATLADITVYGLRPPDPPTYLAFMGDCDGAAREMLAQMVQRAGAGVRRIFEHCVDFDPQADLLQWLLAHDLPVAASFVNWVGRTVVQIREESALQCALTARVPRGSLSSSAETQRLRSELIAFVNDEVKAGHLSLTAPAATPLRWRLARIVNAIAVPLAALILAPVLILAAPLLIWKLRELETMDPEICPRPTLPSLQALERLEDFDVTNQYTALGSIKPGWLRGRLLSTLLVLVQYFCRHVFCRGYLARVQTIHFARWVFLDSKSRMFFASSYDGGHEAYMDDFINKVAWGLNLLFSNGVGWPRTDWLLARGARREHLFKYYQRRHQVPTEVWYKAYPGLTLIDLERNQCIRQGLQREPSSDVQTLAWLKLL